MAIIGGHTLKNQSSAHEELAHRAIVWAAQLATPRGFRADVEIPLAGTYIADAVGQCNFQNRFVQKYGGESGELQSLIFEVKVSRGDFLRTFGPNNPDSIRKMRKGSLHWVVTTTDLVKPEEVPDFWGLLQASNRGLREVKKPIYATVPTEWHNHVASSLLWYGQRRNQRYRSIPICQHCCKPFPRSPQ